MLLIRRTLIGALALLLLGGIAAGCGGDDDASRSAKEDPAMSEDDDAAMPKDDDAAMSEDDDAMMAEDDDAMMAKDAASAKRPAGEDGLRVAAERAQITTGSSEYGAVLFDANGQVVYAFEADERNRSNCTSDECVTAWPPVLTKQAPTAGKGVAAAKLGTIERADGSLQVTYAGRPLYFYEHELPGEIKCHNVDIHGGLWWVVAPDGTPVGT